jgi:thioredoxin reductase (NADPH)
MQQMIYDTLIIGGGPGGYAAALYCARANLSTLVLEKLNPGGQMGATMQVDNYPGFADGISGQELGRLMQEGAERFGAQTCLTEALSVSLLESPKRIVTGLGEYLARAVIAASGAKPKPLGLPGESELTGRGISYCATCDGMFFRNKTVAVVGGGNTAVADALYLANICATVHLIHRRDALRAAPAQAQPLARLNNIVYHWNTEITALQHGKKLSGLALKNKLSGEMSLIACDGLFVAVGADPNTELFAGQLDMDAAGYILADETTRTNVPGVFAVGDLRAKPLRQIVTAVADGAVASKFVEEYLNAGFARKLLVISYE